MKIMQSLLWMPKIIIVLLKKLLSNGINVLMEKPPGLSLDEGNSLVKASTNLQCFIGFDRRF